MAKQIRVEEGNAVDLQVNGDVLVISAARPHYKLSDLVDGINERNRHRETDWGSPVGAEIW